MFQFYDYIQALNIIISLIDTGILTWIPVLIAVGFLLKFVKFPKKLIPLAELVLGIVFARITCLGSGKNIVEIFGYSVGQGLLIAFVAMGFYDIVKGIVEFAKKKRSDSEEKKASSSFENGVTFPESSSENQALDDLSSQHPIEDYVVKVNKIMIDPLEPLEIDARLNSTEAIIARLKAGQEPLGSQQKGE